MVRLLHSISAAVSMAALALAQTSADQQHYHWVFGESGAPTESLQGCGQQLRGQYENLSIYAVPASCPSLQGHANSVPATSLYANLIVVERQHLDGDVVPRDHLDWQAGVGQAIQTLNRQNIRGGAPETSVDDWIQDDDNIPAGGAGRQRPFLHTHHRDIGGDNGGRRSQLCRLAILDHDGRQLLPTKGKVNYRLVVGSSCPAEIMAPLLSDWAPRNTEILPVRTEGAIEPALFGGQLPRDHPIMIKTRKLRHRNRLQKIVDAVADVARMEKDITWLTGEAEGSPFTTRSSTSKQSHEVAAWLQKQFEKVKICDTVELMQYSSRFGPNVLCTIRGQRYPDELVILGAHHDSRGSFFNPRAPGANDDGSGTGMLLAVSRAIAEHGVAFKRTVVLAAFSGEEQGLFGSAAYARKLREQGAKVVTMLQGDMLAYRKPGEPIQTAFPVRHHTPELTDLLVNVTQMYVPETEVGFTAACCSDHQSFFESGFPATAFFERNGPIADPKYHNSADFVHREGYSFEELAANTKAMMASIFELADFSQPSDSSSLDDEEDEI